MVNIIKKQINIFGNDMKYLYVFTLVGWVIGLVVSMLIFKMNPADEKWTSIGVILAAIAGILTMIIFIITSLKLYFVIDISMGLPRKQFFVSYFLSVYLFLIVLLAELGILGMIEKKLGNIFFANLEYYQLPFLWEIIILVMLFMPMLLGLCCMLIQRFGKIAAVPIWILYMMACLLPGRIADAMVENPQSVLGRTGNFVKSLVDSLNFSMQMWSIVVLLATIVIGIVTYHMMRKESI